MTNRKSRHTSIVDPFLDFRRARRLVPIIFLKASLSGTPSGYPCTLLECFYCGPRLKVAMIMIPETLPSITSLGTRDVSCNRHEMREKTRMWVMLAITGFLLCVAIAIEPLSRLGHVLIYLGPSSLAISWLNQQRELHVLLRLFLSLVILVLWFALVYIIQEIVL